MGYNVYTVKRAKNLSNQLGKLKLSGYTFFTFFAEKTIKTI